MVEVKQLPKRSAVPIELTWDLEKVYSSLEEWYKDEKEIKLKLNEFEEYKGKLASNGLLKALQLYLAIYRKYEKAAVFASMKNDQDTTNSTYQKLKSEAENLGTIILVKKRLGFNQN